MNTLSRLFLSVLLCCCTQAAWSAPGDFDNDGVPDAVDVDADNDGIPNINEGNRDTDLDGIPDALDLDSDNDTIPDLVEALKDRVLLLSLDSDLNGQIDAGKELGGNGMVNALEVVVDLQNINYRIPDSDSDRIPDHLDLDSDNDGLSDRIEYRNTSELRFAQIQNLDDPDGNGLDNRFPPISTFFDTDNDGTENATDIDSDQDGLSDLLETGGSGADRDNNGRIDQYLDLDANGYQDSLQGSPLQFIDSDNDGLANHMDLDSDNDGAFDAQEASFPNVNGILVNNPAPQAPTAQVQTPQVQSPQSQNNPADIDAAVVPTGNTTGTTPVANSPNDSTNSNLDPTDNPVSASGVTIITGRDGNALGGCSIAPSGTQHRHSVFAGLEWLLLMMMAAVPWVLNRTRIN